MQALALENSKDYSSLALKQVEIPEPKIGEVLIKIEKAPIYNSDILSIHTKPSRKSSAYLIPGIEGTGTVIKSGGGIKSWFLIGKKISFLQLDDTYAGSWAEYTVCNSKWCKPIEDNKNSSRILIYSSFLAKMAIDTARKNNYSGIILTNADTITGKILLKLALSCKIKCICIVEEKSQKIELKQIGANSVLRPSKNNFNSKLKKLCDDVGPLCTFNVSGGKLISYIVPIIPLESEIYIIDNDSDSQLSGINPSDLIFGGKKIKGLDLQRWLKGLSMRQRLSHLEDIFNEKEIFQINDFDYFSFSDFKNGIINCLHSNSKRQSILNINHIIEESKENENSEEIKQESAEKEEIPEKEEIKENEIEESKEECEINNEKEEEDEAEKEEQAYLESEIQNSESRTVTKLLQSLPKFEWDYQLGDGIETKEMPLKQLPDLSIYRGEWANGSLHGKGTRYYTDGSIYIGYWQNGQSNGKGLFINSDGEWYEGMWKESKFNGFGKHLSQEGQYYEGIFENNFIQSGSEVTFDGNKYEGNFINNEWSGFGSLTIRETEMKYEGEFVKGNISGKGKLFYKDGKVFEGEFEWFNATGTMTYPDGTKFEGKINDCKECGEGKLITADGEVKTGLWKEGQLVKWIEDNKEETENKEEQKEENAEESKQEQEVESKQEQEVESTDKEAAHDQETGSKDNAEQSKPESSEDTSKVNEEESAQTIENSQEAQDAEIKEENKSTE